MYRAFLTSLLLIVLKNAKSLNTEFLDSMSGEIPAGNFSYFSVLYPGIISLVLVSEIGDCDLYVSKFVTKPSFEGFAYCLQSSSCGVDTVVVPKSFKRPISIGVYAHPSFEVSKYNLKIYQIHSIAEDDEKDEFYTTTKYGVFEFGKNSVEEENMGEYGIIPFLSLFPNFLYNVTQYLFDMYCYAYTHSRSSEYYWLEFLI